MKNTSKYIEELLYHHQCVIIPELGAFISNRIPAVINDDKTISPPRKTISFNSRLTSNDGLLVNYISEKENISYEEAQAIVLKSVEEYKKNLRNGSPVKFLNIGSLSQEGEDRLRFIPSNNSNLLTDSFGMTTILPQEADLVQEEKQAPIHMSKDKSQTRSVINPKKGNSLEYMKYAAIIVLGITALSYGILISINSNKENKDAILVDRQSIQKELENHISKATFLSQAPLDLPSLTLNAVKVVDEKSQNTEKKVDLSYHVIAGAFSDKDNANTKVKLLREEGFESNIVAQSRSGLYQVCYQSFETLAEAQAFNKKIRKEKNLDSWVLKTK